MKIEEFSNEFDTLLSSYSSINQFGVTNNSISIELDEYEKSVFLTNAQEEIVIDMYKGNNTLRNSFEKTEEFRRYLSNLIKTYTTSQKEEGYTGLSSSSVFFKIPDDLMFITYESVNVNEEELKCNNTNITVVPVTQDEYHRIRRNPFKWSNNKRVLRLDNDSNIIELISKYTIESYLVRYLSKPTPIILTDLPDNLSINGINVKTECELNPAIHRTILERAVKMALISKLQNINTGKDKNNV